MRAVWKELGVGTEGTLNKQELLLVCNHIGLKDLQSEVQSYGRTEPEQPKMQWMIQPLVIVKEIKCFGLHAPCLIQKKDFVTSQ